MHSAGDVVAGKQRQCAARDVGATLPLRCTVEPRRGRWVELVERNVAKLVRVPRPPKTRVDLAERWPKGEFVFTTPIGTPIEPRNCTRIVQNECERAGLRRVRLHDFRHGCVSVLLGLGVPPRTAMEIVGHSTIEMTMNVYGHVSLDEKRIALDKPRDLFDQDR